MCEDIDDMATDVGELVSSYALTLSQVHYHAISIPDNCVSRASSMKKSYDQPAFRFLQILEHLRDPVE